MAAKDRLFAQFTMLNYLKGSRERSVQEILEHLQANTDWGKAQLRAGAGDFGLRNVQNWLKDIQTSPEFARQIRFRVDPDNRRQHLYTWIGPAVGTRIMPIEEACLVLMAEKFLQAAIPADFMDSGLQELFLAARTRLREYDAIPKQHRKRVRDYLNRIAIEQRGQALVEREIPYAVLGKLSRAILEGKRIECRYRGKPRELHPFGIVLRSPKIYLLAVDDHVIRKVRADELVPAQFLCARISSVDVTDRPNLVPDTFNADDHIRRVGLALDAGDIDGLPTGGFKLVLRLFDAEKDNLLADLEEFPLSEGQEITKEKGTANYLLEARRMRATHQLVEWIVGRLDRVEVVAPASLRAHVSAKLDAMRARYT
jgi:predicted DNA-binding transcriptional regulator YafY